MTSIKTLSLNNTEFLATEEEASKLGIFAAKIAFYNFEYRFITLVMFNSMHAIGLQTFVNIYNQTVILKLGRFAPRHRVAVRQFVIFCENDTQITSMLRWLLTVKYDSSAKIILICASDTYRQQCNEHTIFEFLSDNYILNVILLKLSDLNENSLAYSYWIALPDKCHNKAPDEIDLTSNCADDKCFKDLFPEKLHNFYKCNLVLSTVEQPPFMYLYNGTKAPSGTDGDIMKLIADIINATLVMKTPSDGRYTGHYENNNWTGSLGDVYNDRAHASACSAPLTSNKYGNFQISFTYYSMDMIWVAKVPMETAPWEKLLDPLKPQVRLVLVCTFIVIIIANTIKDTYVWGRVQRYLHVAPVKYNLFFYSWLLFLGMPLVRITTKSFRVIIYVWIWCCFILRYAYQAALINSLKHSVYLDKLETFEEVLRNRYPFGGQPSVRDFYYEDQHIFKAWIVVDLDHLYETFDEILNGTTNFVIAASREIIKHRILKYKGAKQLQIIPDKIVNIPTVIYFKKFSPLASPLNYVLRMAFEAGFIQHFYERYLGNNVDLHERYQTQVQEPLNMNHFAGCFFILTLGWVVSAVYFVVEIVCGNLDE